MAEPDNVRLKGRGHGDGVDDERYEGRGGVFESLAQDENDSTAARSVEGWIVFVTNIHEEAQDDDVIDKFSEYGSVTNFNMNLDRRTGFVKGYALVQYATKEEATEAIRRGDGSGLLGENVHVSWAFSKRMSLIGSITICITENGRRKREHHHHHRDDR